MKKLIVAVITTVWVLMLSTAILAHHGGNLFDMSKPVTLKGTVTKFEWGNPHNKIYFDVSDDKGNVAHWTASTEPPAAMLEKGWTRRSLNPGDQVTVSIFIAKNGAPTGNLHNIVLADGKVLDPMKQVRTRAFQCHERQAKIVGKKNPRFGLKRRTIFPDTRVIIPCSIMERMTLNSAFPR